MIQKIRRELNELKETINVKKETPRDTKCLMMQFQEQTTRRSIIQKIYSATGQKNEESGPIELHYADFYNLSREAREFLSLSEEEKAVAAEKEFPPRHISKEEAAECKRQLMEKLNLMGDRLRHDNNTTN